MLSEPYGSCSSDMMFKLCLMSFPTLATLSSSSQSLSPAVVRTSGSWLLTGRACCLFRLCQDSTGSRSRAGDYSSSTASKSCLLASSGCHCKRWDVWSVHVCVCKLMCVKMCRYVCIYKSTKEQRRTIPWYWFTQCWFNGYKYVSFSPFTHFLHARSGGEIKTECLAFNNFVDIFCGKNYCNH